MKIAFADLQHRWHWVHHVENKSTCLRAGWGISCMLLTCFVSHSNHRFLTYCMGRSCDFSLALLSDEGLWSIFPSDGATHKRTPRTTHPQAQSVPVSLAELQVHGSAAIFLQIFITQLFQQHLMCLTWKYINKRGKKWPQSHTEQKLNHQGKSSSTLTVSAAMNKRSDDDPHVNKKLCIINIQLFKTLNCITQATQSE